MVFCNLSRSIPERFSDGLTLLHRPTDLSVAEEVEDAAQWVLQQAAEAGPGKVLLVNNSGFGSYGHFPEPSVEEQVEMLGVNVTAPVLLTGRLLPLLRERGGAVVNVSSLAAFQPAPYMATYGASKAFLLHWSLALQQELKREGIHVTTLCPGPTASNFYRRAGFATPPMGGKLGKATAEEVVECALQALARGKALSVPGLQNKAVRTLLNPIPKTWQAAAAEFVLRKLRLEKHKEGR